ncbi:MAG TPA: amidohydrolase family protein [Limnochordia bacterium]|nr:amidohydrolase family protein [Limnochordia bacterium]
MEATKAVLIDYHTHIGTTEHWGELFLAESRRMRSSGVSIATTLERHTAAMTKADRVVVLAFRSIHLGFNVPNDYVADYVRRDPKKYIGFLSVDPHDPRALSELERAHQDLGLRGIKMSSIYQAFHPMDTRVLPIYAYAERHGLPLLLHQGTTFPRRAPLKYAHPELLEEVALAFPELRMIIAHLGHPWEVETIAVVRKHPHLYTDISGLVYRPWQLYNSLMLFQEYGVMHKIIFGTDFPVTEIDETIQGLRRLNDMLAGTQLPRLDAEAIEAIITRNVLPELNLA